VCDHGTFTIIERAELVCSHAGVVSVRCLGLEPSPQFQAPFFNVSPDRLPDARKKLTDGNAENVLARERGLKRRQSMSFFIPGYLSAVLATQEISNFALSEAGLFAIGAEIVFESWDRHLGIEIADRCDGSPSR
jgi:hypothetical protein